MWGSPFCVCSTAWRSLFTVPSTPIVWRAGRWVLQGWSKGNNGHTLTVLSFFYLCCSNLYKLLWLPPRSTVPYTQSCIMPLSSFDFFCLRSRILTPACVILPCAFPSVIFFWAQLKTSSGFKHGSSFSCSCLCFSRSSTASAASSWWWFLSTATPSTLWWGSAWRYLGRQSTTSASTSRPAPDQPSSGRSWVRGWRPAQPVSGLCFVNLFFSVIADKISLLTQKVCMCCLTSPDIDLDNIDAEKVK